MDPLLSLLPAAGVFTPLAVVIIYLLRQNAQDRRHYRDDVAAIESRHKTDLEGMEERHIAALAALDAKVNKALTELDDERRKRWAAEDKAAEYRQRLGITEGIHD